MADPKKFKSVSVSIKTYQILDWLRKGKITDAELSISKAIESLAKKKAKGFVIEKALQINTGGERLNKPPRYLIQNEYNY